MVQKKIVFATLVLLFLFFLPSTNSFSLGWEYAPVIGNTIGGVFYFSYSFLFELSDRVAFNMETTAFVLPISAGVNVSLIESWESGFLDFVVGAGLVWNFPEAVFLSSSPSDSSSSDTDFLDTVINTQELGLYSLDYFNLYLKVGYMGFYMGVLYNPTYATINPLVGLLMVFD